MRAGRTTMVAYLSRLPNSENDTIGTEKSEN